MAKIKNIDEKKNIHKKETVCDQTNEVKTVVNEEVEINESKNGAKKVFKKILNFIIVTMNGMAYGLFSTLIIGTIINLIGNLTGWSVLNDIFGVLKSLTYVGIGIGVAWALKFDGIKLIVVGIAAGLTSAAGDILVAYIVAITAALICKYVFIKKTPVDIIIVPLLTLFVSYMMFLLVKSPIAWMMKGINTFIEFASGKMPFTVGVVVSVVMGMALTAPISSAAIAVAINLGGIAGGAAVVGCCCQMLGFAVMSRKDNNLGVVCSIGIGTSMLQFKNVLKKPIIWLPPIIASAILGPLATLVFKLECTPMGAGMGTSGLVGQFGTFEAMGATTNFYFGLILLEIVLPIAIVWGLDILFRKFNLIKPGDLKL